jgi:hypothetical protein
MAIWTKSQVQLTNQALEPTAGLPLPICGVVLPEMKRNAYRSYMFGPGAQLGNWDTDTGTQSALCSHAAYYSIVQSPGPIILHLLASPSSSFRAEVAILRFLSRYLVFWKHKRWDMHKTIISIVNFIYIVHTVLYNEGESVNRSQMEVKQL